MSFHVYKVGGSLLSLVDLGTRLRAFHVAENNPRVLLVPGGGVNAKPVRLADLTQEEAHWSAIKVMASNSHLLSAMLNAPVVTTLSEALAAWQYTEFVILDALAFCLDDELQSEHLPHNWDVTSDSIAARVAVRWQAERVVLLKSTEPPGPVETWPAAGYCDPWLLRVIAGHPLTVSAVNLRTK